MSPSSIFWTPLAEFQGRVPDPKQGMFRKSTECTLEPEQMKLIILGSPSTRSAREMLRTPCVPSALKLCPDHRIQLSRTWRWKVGSDYDIIPVTRCTYSLSFFHFAFKRSTPPAWWNFGDQCVCLSWRRWNLSVIHLVPHSVVELSRIRLSVWNRCLLRTTHNWGGFFA